LNQAVPVLRDAAAHDEVDLLGPSPRTVEAVAGGRSRKAQQCLGAHRDVSLVDAGEPLEIDPGAMTGRAHESLGGQAGGGQHAPDPGDAGDVRRRVAVGCMLHEHPRRRRRRAGSSARAG
jgi:hypothetical protein